MRRWFKDWKTLSPQKKGRRALAVWGGTTLVCCLINLLWYGYNANKMGISVLDPPRFLPFLGFLTLGGYLAVSFWAAGKIATEIQRKYFSLWWKLAVPAFFSILPMFCLPLSKDWKWVGAVLQYFLTICYLPYVGCGAVGTSSLLVLAPAVSMTAMILICGRAKKAISAA